jgi:hypothetical protein
LTAPEVLHLILCGRVETDPTNYHRHNILGLVTSIRSNATPRFPVVHSQLTAVAVWTGGHGTGDLALRIVGDRAAGAVFQTRPRPIRFAGDPAAAGGVVFRIRNCRFPAAGLYWVEIWFADLLIARQKLFVRDREIDL